MEARDRQAQSAARLSLFYNCFQTALKLFGAALTGSVSLLSEGLHSLSDILSSFISFVSIRAASAPPDEEHPYGHGKIDTLAGLSEAIVLFLFSVYTCILSTMKFFQKPEVLKVDAGVGIIVACTLLGGLIFNRINQASKECESFALKSNAQHLLVDLATSIGVLVALLVTRFTGWHYADPLFGLGLSLWLGYSSVRMIHRSFDEVIDRRIEPEELSTIEGILESEPDLLSYHKLRTRHSGNVHYIDVHLVVPRTWSVVQGHELADRVEKAIESALDPAVCTVHVDPSDE
ncbi:MAG: cation transporter [Armatimonadetes bacterium]|nr:cation transporter [Armatimonadota bacterium]